MKSKTKNKNKTKKRLKDRAENEQSKDHLNEKKNLCKESLNLLSFQISCYGLFST